MKGGGDFCIRAFLKRYGINGLEEFFGILEEEFLDVDQLSTNVFFEQLLVLKNGDGEIIMQEDAKGGLPSHTF
jgi:hypothetical protein